MTFPWMEKQDDIPQEQQVQQIQYKETNAISISEAEVYVDSRHELLHEILAHELCG